jgi:RNA polymerase sigma-B factor
MSLQPMLAALKPRERRILTLRFDDGMSQTAIATLIGISQMQVSRLIKQSLDALRASMEEPATGVES